MAADFVVILFLDGEDMSISCTIAAEFCFVCVSNWRGDEHQ
jgi:hypothetical protein